MSEAWHDARERSPAPLVLVVREGFGDGWCFPMGGNCCGCTGLVSHGLLGRLLSFGLLVGKW